MAITLKIQMFVASHRQEILTFFHVCEVGLAMFTIVFSIAGMLHPAFLVPLFMIASKFGEAAAIMLSITLTPGILGRLGILPIPRATLMMFRRHFGISTYLLVVTHSLFMYWLPAFKYGFAPLQLFQLCGILALSFATPLFITSNDYSQRVMQKWWKRLHKLVYLMLIFGMLHTLVAKVSVWGLLLAGVAVLEVISFLVQYKHAHTLPRG